MPRLRLLQSPRPRFAPAIAAFALILAASASALVAQASEAAVERGEVVHLRLKTIIHPVAASHVQRGIAAADAAGAAAVVLQLDTPGGLMTSTREITTAILNAETPVVVWVAPSGAQAASAGFFVLMAADVAAMSPGTNTGAAHPVGGGGEDLPGHLGEKAEQDAAANIRALAARNGRDQKLAEAAVVESRSFTADEALTAGLVDVVAPDLRALLQAIDGRPVRRGERTVALATAGAAVREIEMPLLKRVLAAIAHPEIAYLLLALGGLGLYFELMNPGAILPGVVGGICLILAFYALSVLPVDYAGVALILLAMLLFIAEIKVTSYGLLTVGGVVALVLGGLMLFDSPEPALRVGLDVLAATGGFALAVVGFLVVVVLRTTRNPVATGAEGLLHEIGTARSLVAPRGRVFIHGEIWNAVADEPVAPGEPVEVVAVEGLTLKVRPRRSA